MTRGNIEYLDRMNFFSNRVMCLIQYFIDLILRSLDSNIFWEKKQRHIIIISIAVQKWYYLYPCLPWWLQWIPLRLCHPIFVAHYPKTKRLPLFFNQQRILMCSGIRIKQGLSGWIRPKFKLVKQLVASWNLHGVGLSALHPDFMNLEITSISPLLKFVSIVLWSHYWYLENDLFILYLHIQNTTQTYVSGLLKNSQHLGVTL